MIAPHIKDYIVYFEKEDLTKIMKLCLNQYRSKWRYCNRDKVNDYGRLFYYENRDRLLKERKQKVKCPNCDKFITKRYLKKHMETKKCKEASCIPCKKNISISAKL